MSGSRVNLKATLCSRKFCMRFFGVSLAIALVVPPIAVFVIAPALAQHIMYNTVISIPNTTTVPCGTPHTWMMNTLKIDVPGIFSASLKPYTTVISTTICGDESDPKLGTTCKDSKVVPMFNYSAPPTDLQAGTNHVQQSVATNFIGPNAKNIFLSAFTIPMFGDHVTTELIIESPHIDMVAGLKVLGIKFGISVKALKLHNKLSCSAVAMHPSLEIPDAICQPDKAHEDAAGTFSEKQTISRRRLDASQSYEVRCTPGAPKVEYSLSFLA